MSFNSIAFLVFITVFFLFWPLVKRKKNIKFIFLILSSFVFYGWWDWRFLFLIIFSGLVDFYAAKLIHKYSRKARFFLILSLLVNLASLSIFKYSGFFAEQLEFILKGFSIQIALKEKLPAFTYILPIGISFYTFQSMSYTVDVYRKKLAPTNNIYHFFAYLVMFPQLVAGPIIRARDFLAQLLRHRAVTGVEFWHGMKLILLGYFQKTVLADNLGVFVDKAFAGVHSGEGIYWWVVIISFSFQIYFDFCGYSQIARGLAKLMGYHFRMNFNHPHLALSMRDFWNRWHISLSTWFRDYVYIPMGGSKKGILRGHINLWVTMLLSGLWHGAAVNFVVWGGFHAVVLSLERALKQAFGSVTIPKWPLFFWVTTTIQVLIGWVLFRASSWEQILDILKSLFTWNLSFGFVGQNIDSMLFLAIAILFEGGYYITKRLPLGVLKDNRILDALFYALIVAAIIFLRGPAQEFIYFQF